MDGSGVAGGDRPGGALSGAHHLHEVRHPSTSRRDAREVAELLREVARGHREHLDPRLLELLPPLAKLVPPATVFDKTRYSAFFGTQLRQHLNDRRADGLVITGSETDVCVLATVIGAVDLGYRVILVRDAVCSSSDAGHDALLEVYHRRYSVQIETADAETVLSKWR